MGRSAMKDNKNIFCDKVCSYIDYATGKELEQVRGELRDHLEDHAQALMEIGRSREEAEEASILAMGDPEEIGRELNKQFPFIWLFLSRATIVIAVILALLLLSPLSDLLHLANESLTARKNPIELFEDQGTAIDIRISLPENDIAYFYSVDLETLGEDNYRVLIGLVVYDENPFGRVSKNALDFKIEKEGVFYLPAGGSTMGYGIHRKNSRKIFNPVRYTSTGLNICLFSINMLRRRIPETWRFLRCGWCRGARRPAQ